VAARESFLRCGTGPATRAKVVVPKELADEERIGAYLHTLYRGSGLYSALGRVSLTILLRAVLRFVPSPRWRGIVGGASRYPVDGCWVGLKLPLELFDDLAFLLVIGRFLRGLQALPLLSSMGVVFRQTLSVWRGAMHGLRTSLVQGSWKFGACEGGAGASVDSGPSERRQWGAFRSSPVRFEDVATWQMRRATQMPYLVLGCGNRPQRWAAS
jgi:hypothetical protein